MNDDYAPDRHIGVGMGGSCPECSSPVDLAQEFCLECGSPVRARKRSRRSPAAVAGPGSSRNFPWIPFLVVLGLAALGLIWFLGFQDNGGGNNANTATPTTPTVDPSTLTNETPSFPTTPEEPTTVPETPPLEPVPTPDPVPPITPTPDPGTSDDAWPSGKDGWTVIVHSLPKDSYSRDDAEARAVEAEGDGIDAGVIDSNNFSTLTAGYWVVFSGVFDTEPAAKARYDEIRNQNSRYQGVYVGEIKPNA